MGALARRAWRCARCALLLAATIGAVAAQTADGAQPVAAIDDAGMRVALARPAQRIVALAPHITELLFAAGAGSRIVGVVAGSNFPVEASRIAVVGDANAIDLERVFDAAPDLVVTWPYTTSAQLAAIRRRGIAVFTSDATTIDRIAGDIEALGTLAGTSGDAARAAATFRATIEAARRRAPVFKPPLRVFYEIWGEPVFTVGGGHLISQAIELCGGRNVFSALATPAPVVSEEAVIAAQPQVIVAGTDGARRPAWLDTWRHWPQIPAVRDGRLRVVDADLLHRSGPRFAEGVVALCAALRD